MATDVLAPTTQIVTSTLPAATVAPTTQIVTSILPAATVGATAGVDIVFITSTHEGPIFISTSLSLPASTLPASSTSAFSTIHPTSPTPRPGGLSTSAKIGIGLGVPLGVIVLAIVAFLGYLYGKRRGNKRNAIPAAEEQFHGFPGDKGPSAMQGQYGSGAVGPQGSDNNGELPRYAEELQGSPGVKRHELPAQREVTGYFSPDVVSK